MRISIQMTRYMSVTGCQPPTISRIDVSLAGDRRFVINPGNRSLPGGVQYGAVAGVSDGGWQWRL